MDVRLIPVVCLLGGALVARPVSAQVPAAVPAVAPAATVFVDVSVIPMDREQVLAHQTVVVRGDHIVAIGSTKQVEVPAGAVRIDGAGKYLIPGLADMHAHIGFPQPAPDDSTFEKALFFYLANGVTTIRDMHGGYTTPSPRLALKHAIAAGRVLGPRMYVAGDPAYFVGSVAPMPLDSHAVELAARSIAGMKALGYDFVKMPYLPPDLVPGELRRAMVDSVAAAAKREGLRVVGHTPEVPMGVDDALRIPYASIEHLVGYPEALLGLGGKWSFDQVTQQIDTAAWLRPDFRVDEAKLRELAEATRMAGVWVCPTLWVLDVRMVGSFLPTPDEYARLYPRTPKPMVDSYAEQYAQWPRREPAMRAFRRMVELDMRITKALQDAGAGLLLGADQTSDQLQGFGVPQELQLLVKSGLTPYQALVTGTRNAAAFLGTLDSTGTIAVGKRADLVLLNGNPLEDVRHAAGPAGVMVGGRWLSRAEIDARIDAWGTYGEGEHAIDLKEARRFLWTAP